MPRVRLTVDLEVVDGSKTMFVYCRLPDGKEWAVPQSIYDKHCFPIEEMNLEESNLEPTEKLYLVINPKNEDWVTNKDWIKAHGGVFVPKKKCWVICWDGYDLEDHDLTHHTSVYGKLQLNYLPVGDDLYHLVKDISTGRYAQPIQ